MKIFFTILVCVALALQLVSIQRQVERISANYSQISCSALCRRTKQQKRREVLKRAFRWALVPELALLARPRDKAVAKPVVEQAPASTWAPKLAVAPAAVAMVAAKR